MNARIGAEQFGANWTARASYVGDHTDHIPYNATNINIPVTQTPDETIQDQRPYQPWKNIN